MEILVNHPGAFALIAQEIPEAIIKFSKVGMLCDEYREPENGSPKYLPGARCVFSEFMERGSLLQKPHNPGCPFQLHNSLNVPVKSTLEDVNVPIDLNSFWQSQAPSKTNGLQALGSGCVTDM